MRAKKTRTNLRQEQIAQAALRIIGEVGLPGLSIAKIAQQVGISASNIYRHYANKEEVIDAVLDLVQHWLMDNIHAACAENTSSLKRLQVILERHANMLKENPGVLLLMISAAQHGKKPEVHNIITQYQAALSTIITQGQNSAELNSESPPQTLALMLIGILLPAALMLNLTDKNFNIDQHIQSAWPIYKKYITNERGLL